MTIGPLTSDEAVIRNSFIELRSLFDSLNEHLPSNKNMTELSMGMSGDFEAAIAEGATIVRIGTAIFGPRQRL